MAWRILDLDAKLEVLVGGASWHKVGVLVGTIYHRILRELHVKLSQYLRDSSDSEELFVS